MNIPPIKQTVIKLVNNAANSQFMSKMVPERAGDMAATIAIASTTTKDLVNCGYYTYQSLTNDRIPEEKRKFVAGIDLSNGILNVLGQLTVGMFVKNRTDDWFDRLFISDKTIFKGIANKVRNLDKSLIKCARGGFGLIVTLLTCQVLLKRVVTPFIATPMAHYFKEYADKKMSKNIQNNEQDTDAQTVKTDNPSPKTLDIVSLSTPSGTFKGFYTLLHPQNK